MIVREEACLDSMMEEEATEWSVSAPNFAFAFNDSNFSDRTLRIEIVEAPPESKCSVGGPVGNDEWARHRKRRRAERKEPLEGEAAVTMLMGQEEQPVSGNSHEADEAPNEIDEEAFVMMEDLSPQAMQSSPSPGLESPQSANMWNASGPVVRTRSVHISSAILAAKSPYFYKLFSNGMRESEQRYVTIRINTSEESALMDLLQFMYSGKIGSDDPSAVLDVLMTADRFEVPSCMSHCSRLLRSLPMTPDLALRYLELPSSILLGEAVQPLIEAARLYLAAQFRDLTTYEDRVMNLPLVGLEPVLSSDTLQVASEDAVYDFAIKWGRRHYPKLETRKEVLARLVWYIRFPMMSTRKLRKVLSCSDLESDLASKLVVEALFFKAESHHRQRQMASDDSNHKRFVERAYKYRPVKVVEFDTPHYQCVVYLDLRLEDIKALWQQGRLYSQAFHLGGQGFFLSAHCNLDQQGDSKCFGLFLGMQEKGSVSLPVDYEFAARTKPSWEFDHKSKGDYTFTGGKAVGYRNLFGLPWPEFIDNGTYFRDGVLHLQAKLTIKSKANLVRSKRIGEYAENRFLSGISHS